MSLQAAVMYAFRKHVFQPLYQPGSWKILIMDERATRVVSSVYKMHDITEFGITLVESLYKVRRPFNMEAIYIMYPHRREVDLFLRDFSSEMPTYPAAHVFFLLPCPRDVLNVIAASRGMQYVKTLEQLDLDFIPIESCLFSLECQETGQTYSLPARLVPDKKTQLEQLAEQLATVCVTLDEYPRIFYRKDETNLELAQMTLAKLDACRESNPSMGQGTHKDRSILLILDRGFDPVTPLLHELTLQAMCYDLLTVVDNVYTYGNNQKVDLTGQDTLWKELKHMHIADVTRTLPQRVREFADSKKQFASIQNRESPSEGGFDNKAASLEPGEKGTLGLRELSNIIKRMPQYQSEASSYTAAYSITEACMNVFRQGVDKLCGLEQDLVMGQTAEGEPVRDPMRCLSDMFRYDFTSVDDRLRLLMIFVLIKNGISETHLEKLLSTARVDRVNKALFASLSILIGAQLIHPERSSLTGGYGAQPSSPSFQFSQCECVQHLPTIASVADRVQRYLPMRGDRKDRVDPNSYAFSRWSPYLVDLIEEAIEGKLNRSHYTFLVGRNPIEAVNSVAPAALSPKAAIGPSARFQAGGPAGGRGAASDVLSPSSAFGTFSDAGKNKSSHCGPRLIVCIVGGVCWSEVRTAYQMTQKCIETRLAASDRHTAARTPNAPPAAVVAGGGGVGWNWEIMIGGTHVVSPTTFIGDLDNMSRYFAAASTQAPPKEAQPRRSSLANFHRF
ncbi:Syntaxin-binding protein 2 [Clonorchis sinensis]|uniref:Syntaxin-binding protein 2 n=1 Tax=Clonorchis sinensis TaxID=79923 RepID=A0A8T1ME78_CLOSI|nr:Syntaxin-binding protein 2 [Clonorchis sinensis]